MANPQPEPFVKFSKELFDALLLSPMPATHKEIVLAVIRRTYGDHGQKAAPIALSLLVAMTGRGKSGIGTAVQALRKEGVLRQVSGATFKTPAVYALNKDYERWGKWSVQSTSRADSTTTADSTNTTVRTVPAERTRTVPAERTIEDKGIDQEEPLLPPRAVGEDFETFWKAYPKKVAKPDALRAFTKARTKKKVPLETIMAGLRMYLPVWAAKDKEFVPYPASWLNDERWADELTTATGNGNAPPSTLVRPETVARLRAMVAQGDNPEDLRAMCASEAEYAAVTS